MTFNKILTFLGGAGLSVYNVISALDGEISGLASTGHSRTVVVSEEPIYFWITVIISGVFGVLLIYSSVEKKE